MGGGVSRRAALHTEAQIRRAVSTLSQRTHTFESDQLLSKKVRESFTQRRAPQSVSFSAMRSPRKHVQCSTSRHGRVCYYFRIGQGPRTRLPDDPRSEAFANAYFRALRSEPAPPLPPQKKPKTITPRARLNWISKYRRGNRHLNPNNRREGLVYFLRFGDWVKIGFTINVEKRVKHLRTALPGEPVLLGTLPGTRVDENRLQTQFKPHRARGEWFHIRDDLEAWIAATFEATG